jgi:mono/diheme cytochrome c family protein
MKIKSNIQFFAVLLAVLVFASCSRDRNHPGRAYMADFDMYHSKAYEYYSPNPNFKDGKTAQAPVEGTVPRGDLPYTVPNSAAGLELSAKLVNPDSVMTKESLIRGQEQYNIYCAVCHAESGNGQGSLYTSKNFTVPPRDLTSDRVQVDLNDGQVYHVITVGTISRLMGPHGAQVKPADRWKIVNYIKNKFSVNPKQ